MNIDELESSNNVLAEVLVEREAQHKKWGEQNHKPGTVREFLHLAEFFKRICAEEAKSGTITWCDIFFEEVYEAASETDMEKLRIELIQVAAVACAFVESLDRNELNVPKTQA